MVEVAYKGTKRPSFRSPTPGAVSKCKYKFSDRGGQQGANPNVLRMPDIVAMMGVMQPLTQITGQMVQLNLNLVQNVG